MTHRQRRRILVASYAAATALMVAACGSHTPSWFPMQAQKTSKTHAPDAAPATSVSPPKPLPANNLKSLVLSNEDVNEIVGLPLSDRSQFDSPTASASDYTKPDCALTMGITKDALGDGEFTAYRSIRNQASKDDSLVGMFSQNFATFETSDKASEIFHKAYATLGHCNSATIAAKDNPATWKILASGPFNGDAVTFGALQFTDKNQPLGWRCDHQARVKNNVIVEASMCAWANGASASAAAVDQISARIPPPDKPAPPAPAGFLAPNKIKSVIVDVPQASKILGTNLGDSRTVLYPPAPRDFGDKSNCSPLEGPDANSFGIDVDYTAYRGYDYREAKDNYQHIVDQQVATYPDARDADRNFHNALSGLNWMRRSTRARRDRKQCPVSTADPKRHRQQGSVGVDRNNQRSTRGLALRLRLPHAEQRPIGRQGLPERRPDRHRQSDSRSDGSLDSQVAHRALEQSMTVDAEEMQVPRLRM